MKKRELYYEKLPAEFIVSEEALRRRMAEGWILQAIDVGRDWQNNEDTPTRNYIFYREIEE